MRANTIGSPESTTSPPQASVPAVPRDLVSIHDLSPAEIYSLFDLTALVKKRPADFCTALSGKQMAMFFEKPSLRTRLTFEAGMASLGGSAFFFDQTTGRLNARESLYDIAHNLERWVDLIVLRTYSHATIEEMATYAGVPVINALSEFEHPCQALADFFTLQEHFGDLKKLHFAYVGDGNNMAHSLLLAGASVGATVSIATPEKYCLSPVIVTIAEAIARETRASLRIMTDPRKAVANADAVYTDAWASMGHESEAEERASIFTPYQVNAALMQLAKPHARFMHCLPAHRGSEVTDKVIDSLNSVVFDQAENRLHIQKAILLFLLGAGASTATKAAHGNA